MTSYLLAGALAVSPEAGPPGSSPITWPVRQQRCDILISADGTIAAIAQPAAGSRPDVHIVDCSDAVVIPGFVDTHRHLWQTLFKTLPADWTLFQCLTDLNIAAASLLTPDDVYVAQLCGAMEAMAAGITTTLDHFHVANSPAHVDAGLAASRHSGMRIVFAMGTNCACDSRWQLDTLQRLAADAQNSSDVVRIGLALDRWKASTHDHTHALVSTARTSGARPITLHVSNGVLNGIVDEPVLHAPLADFLGPDILLSHANRLTPRELAAVAHHDVKLSATCEAEHHLNMGKSILDEASACGCCVGLGTDTPALVEGSFFGAMRAALAESRRARNDEWAQRDCFPRRLEPRVHEILARATAVGSQVLGLHAGVLQVGAAADLVVLRNDRYNMLGAGWPGRDAAAAIVTQATLADVRDVFVAGRLVVSQGKLAPLSDDALRSLRVIAQRRQIDHTGCGGHDLLHKLAKDNAAKIHARMRQTDIEGLRGRMASLLGVAPRFC
ncbi:unnamed protein product [Parajaminaea phylloscopi]